MKVVLLVFTAAIACTTVSSQQFASSIDELSEDVTAQDPTCFRAAAGKAILSAIEEELNAPSECHSSGQIDNSGCESEAAGSVTEYVDKILQRLTEKNQEIADKVNEQIRVDRGHESLSSFVNEVKSRAKREADEVLEYLGNASIAEASESAQSKVEEALNDELKSGSLGESKKVTKDKPKKHSEPKANTKEESGSLNESAPAPEAEATETLEEVPNEEPKKAKKDKSKKITKTEEIQKESLKKDSKSSKSAEASESAKADATPAEQESGKPSKTTETGTKEKPKKNAKNATKQNKKQESKKNTNAKQEKTKNKTKKNSKGNSEKKSKDKSNKSNKSTKQ